MERSLVATEEAARAAVKSANTSEESVRQSKSSLDATVRAFESEQRAWIAVKAVNIEPPNYGKSMKVDIVMLNCGKTPALNVRYPGIMIHRRGAPVSDVETIKSEYPIFDDPNHPKTGVLFPNIEFFIPIKDEPMVTPDFIAALRRDDLQIYLIGVITYDDVFGREHQTRFFFRYLHAENRFATQSTHYDAT